MSDSARVNVGAPVGVMELDAESASTASPMPPQSWALKYNAPEMQALAREAEVRDRKMALDNVQLAMDVGAVIDEAARALDDHNFGRWKKEELRISKGSIQNYHALFRLFTERPHYRPIWEELGVAKLYLLAKTVNHKWDDILETKKRDELMAMSYEEFATHVNAIASMGKSQTKGMSAGRVANGFRIRSDKTVQYEQILNEFLEGGGKVSEISFQIRKDLHHLVAWAEKLEQRLQEAEAKERGKAA